MYRPLIDDDPLTRDERVLSMCLAGSRSAAEIQEATGWSRGRVYDALHHLTRTGLLWSPEWGRYQLTGRGADIAAGIFEPAAAPERERRGSSRRPRS